MGDDAAAVGILRSAAAAAGGPGPRVLVLALEAVVPHGDGPRLSKAIDLTMLGMVTDHERSTDEFTALLDAAEITLDRVAHPQPLSVLEATVR